MTSEKELITAALRYQEQGLSVIPIQPKDKKPLIQWESFQQKRAPKEVVISWWNRWRNANIGIVTGSISGIVVIDLDSKEAGAELRKLCPGLNLSSIPFSTTGKGYHLIFKHPGEKTPNRAAIRPQIDFRGDGGYIVAPPSIHPSGAIYTWHRTIDLTALPELSDDLVKLIVQAPYTATGFAERFDTRAALQGVAEGQRDQTIFKLACKLRAADVPYEMAIILCEESSAHCDPPFTEAKAKVDQAYNRYAPGHSKTLARVEPEQEAFWPEPLTMKQFKAKIVDATRWLWKDALPINSTSLLVGQPRAGKSTLALNLALAISRGIAFLGRPTMKVPTFYVSIDNSDDEMRDIMAKLGVVPEDQVYIHVGRVPQEATKWLCEMIEKYQIKLAVIDTFQRFFHVEEINRSEMVVQAMEPLDFEAKKLGCHVMYLHHAGKGSNGGLTAGIGSISIKGMCPWYFELSRLEGGTQRILNTDFRGGRNFEQIFVKVDPHTGWSIVAGDIQDAYVENLVPSIVEALEAAPGLSESDLRKAILGRAIAISKAIKKLYELDEIQRVGRGRRGDPFRYSLAIGLDVSKYKRNTTSYILYKGTEAQGQECGKVSEPNEMVEENTCPEIRDTNGTRKDTNQNSILANSQVSRNIEQDTCPEPRDTNNTAKKYRIGEIDEDGFMIVREAGQ